jgi:hypothetical protein
MVENMNKLLESNEVQVRIGTEWYRLEEIGPIGDDEFPIVVTDESGGEWDYDMADIDEIDPIFDLLREINSQSIIGIA